MKKKYTLGTRGSLLAVTQSKLILEELKEKTNLDFEIKTIKTQGDLITDKPLWQLDGKDFFTKELDTALLNGDVDFVIHSYKDLGSDRPEGIELAAIPPRIFANDILLFRKESLQNKKSILIGTSSPRRITNIESSLKEFLPIDQNCTLKCESLRGNVNTRIEKLREKQYDGIILAMAGLERLARRDDSKKILSQLLDGLLLSILPQSEFPSSSSQGALAIEFCPNNNPELKEVFSKVHCDKTQQLVSIERSSFSKYGGGCHLAVGIHVKKVPAGLIEIHKGIHKEKEINLKVLHPKDNLTRDLEAIQKSKKIFIGLPQISANYSGVKLDELLDKKHLQVNSLTGDLIVTSKYCINALESNQNTNNIWSSGIHTWKRLTRKGHWVIGSADSFGLHEIFQFEKSELIKIYLRRELDWNILTAQGVLYDQRHTAVYERIMNNPSEQEKLDLDNIDVFFWSSFYQYQNYIKKIPSIKSKKHYCGVGKTLDQFNQHDIEVTPIINMSELKNHLGKRK